MSEQANPPPRRLLTLPEAAAHLRISRSSLYRLFWRDELPSIHVGGRHLVSTRALEAYLDALEGVTKEEVEA